MNGKKLFSLFLMLAMSAGYLAEINAGRGGGGGRGMGGGGRGGMGRGIGGGGRGMGMRGGRGFGHGGRGFGRGRGWGGRGRGFGRSWGWGAGFWPYYGGGYWPYAGYAAGYPSTYYDVDVTYPEQYYVSPEYSSYSTYPYSSSYLPGTGILSTIL